MDKGRKLKYVLASLGWVLVLSGAAYGVPPTAVTDEIDLGLVNEEIESSLPPIPDVTDIGEDAVDDTGVLGGGCTAYAWDPYLSDRAIRGEGEMNCSQPKVHITITVQLQVKISGQWHNFGAGSFAEAFGENDAETFAMNGCIDGTWKYRTKAKGTAESDTTVTQTDSDRSAATPVKCNVLGAPSVKDFLQSIDRR